MNQNKEKFEQVEVELDDQILLELALEAHRRDITLNALCNDILQKHIKENETKNGVT